VSIVDNKALARVWWDEVINNRDVTAIERTYADDYVHRGPDGHAIGRDEAVEVAKIVLASSHDRKAKVVYQLADGDVVVTRWESRGTLTGPLFGCEPTGKPVLAQGIVISRIKDGRIAEDWEMLDLRDDPYD
jgi:predicted SnoaL-like aldol condensation-catalyzing enzyme